MELFNFEYSWIFLTTLPIVSFMYAAVGHGGASGYLALMTLFGFLPETMKPTALLLNLFVAGIAFIHYARKGHFNKRLFIVFAIASVPMAFLGGLISVETLWYRQILGVLLIFATLKMLNVFGNKQKELSKIKVGQGLASGGLIGFFSGLIGIGGGIILSPLILIMRWGTVKTAAAVSALFIWVNSAAGLGGQLSSGVKINPQALILVSIALIGGFIGGYLGSSKLNTKGLRYMLAFVLVIASIKLILT